MEDKDGVKDRRKLDIEGWNPADCLAEEYDDATPESEGCPNYIPQECIDSSQTIVDTVHDWALNQKNIVNGKVNPQALMIWPLMHEITELQETGKFMLTSQDNSELSDKLKETTKRRGFSASRWDAPIVNDFVDGVRVGRIEYSNFPSNRKVDVQIEDCDD